MATGETHDSVVAPWRSLWPASGPAFFVSADKRGQLCPLGPSASRRDLQFRRRIDAYTYKVRFWGLLLRGGKMSEQFTAKTQAQVAAFFGRSLATVEKWARQGMPGRPGCYSLKQIALWLFLQGPWRSETARSDVLDNLIHREPE